MPAVVDIVNRALVSLGAATIVALDQGGTAADSAQAIWTQVRDDVLRSHPWKCCSARAELPALADAPAFEYDVAYQLPSDWLRMIEVNGLLWPLAGWKVEGRKLLTNDGAPCQIVYVRREEDTNLYDPELVTALAAQLAYELAPKLSALPTREDRAEKKAELALSKAKGTDALEEDLVENPLEGGWTSARYE